MFTIIKVCVSPSEQSIGLVAIEGENAPFSQVLVMTAPLCGVNPAKHWIDMLSWYSYTDFEGVISAKRTTIGEHCGSEISRNYLTI